MCISKTALFIFGRSGLFNLVDGGKGALDGGLNELRAALVADQCVHLFQHFGRELDLDLFHVHRFATHATSASGIRFDGQSGRRL